MFKHYLMPLDGSEQSEQIGRWVIRLAERFDASTTLLGVIAPRSAKLGEVKDQKAESLRYLKAVAEKSASHPDKIHTRVAMGKPADAIVKVAHEISADAIALCTRRASTLARTILGSVTDHVLRHAKVPVLVANPKCLITLETSADVPQTMIVPLDGSRISQDVLPVAYELAYLARARMVFMQSTTVAFANETDRTSEAHAKLLDYLKPYAERAHSLGLEADCEAVVGTAGKAILDRSERSPGSLILMATHGHTGFRRAVLGSVTNQVIRFSSCPVLVIPPKMAAGQDD